MNLGEIYAAPWTSLQTVFRDLLLSSYTLQPVESQFHVVLYVRQRAHILVNSADRYRAVGVYQLRPKHHVTKFTLFSSVSTHETNKQGDMHTNICGTRMLHLNEFNALWHATCDGPVIKRRV